MSTLAFLAPVAPALALAAVAALVVTVLGRWWERPPAAALALYAAAVVVLFGPALIGIGPEGTGPQGIGGESADAEGASATANAPSLLPLDNLRGDPPFTGLDPVTVEGRAEPGNPMLGDLLLLVHPARRMVEEGWSRGAWPLWHPGVGGGTVVLADPQAQALAPLGLLALPLPDRSELALLAALRLFLGLVFAHLLLARLGAGAAAAATGAKAYGLGGFAVLWAGWPLADAAVFLPAAAWALLLVHDRDRRRDRGLLVACGACLLLAGHPETIAYALAVLAGLALVLAGRKPRRERAVFLRRAAAALALALALAAPALGAFAEALPGSLRAERVGVASPADETVAPATRLVQAVAPKALGESRFFHYWGLRNSPEDAATFPGTVAWLLVLTTVLSGLGRLRSPGGEPRARARPSPPQPVRLEGFGLLVAGAGLVLLALPGGFLGLVPAGGLSGRLALPVLLGLALVAAASVERSCRDRAPLWPVLAAAAILAGVHLAAHRLLAAPGVAADAPEALGVLRHGFLLWHLRFLVVGTVLVLALRLAARSGRVARGRALPAALALLALVVAPLILPVTVATESLLVHREAWPVAPGRLAFPETPALEAVVAADPGNERLAGLDGVFPPNLAPLYDLADARIYNPMARAAWLAALGPAVAGWEGEAPVLAVTGTPDPDAARDALVRAGVSRLLLGPGAPCPEGTEPLFAGADATVCSLPGPHPLLALMSESTASDSTAPGDAAPRALEATWSPGEAAWRAPIEATPVEASPIHGEPGPAAGDLVTSLAAAPGWRLLVDGRPIVLEPPGAGPFVAASPVRPVIRSDGGSAPEQLALLYRPAGHLLGLLAAALGLAAALAWLARPPAAATPPSVRTG